AVMTNTTRSELESNATLTGAHNVTLAATGTHTTSTSAEAGAAGGDTVVAGSAAVTVADDESHARVNTGSTALVLVSGGILTLHATNTGNSSAVAGGDSAGSGVVVGAAVAVDVATDVAEARLSRNTTAPGGLSLVASNTATSSAEATRGAKGAAPAAPKADAAVTDELGTFAPAVVPPSLTSLLNAAANKATVNVAAVGVGAAVAVNVARPTTTAKVDDGLTITGGVGLSAGLTVDAHARGDGTANLSTTAVGAAIGANVVFADTEA